MVGGLAVLVVIAVSGTSDRYAAPALVLIAIFAFVVIAFGLSCARGGRAVPRRLRRRRGVWAGYGDGPRRLPRRRRDPRRPRRDLPTRARGARRLRAAAAHRAAGRRARGGACHLRAAPLNVLPGSVAERLKAGETTIADAYDDATVLFADLVGFTSLASTSAGRDGRAARPPVSGSTAWPKLMAGRRSRRSATRTWWSGASRRRALITRTRRGDGVGHAGRGDLLAASGPPRSAHRRPHRAGGRWGHRHDEVDLRPVGRDGQRREPAGSTGPGLGADERGPRLARAASSPNVGGRSTTRSWYVRMSRTGSKSWTGPRDAHDDPPMMLAGSIRLRGTASTSTWCRAASMS